MAYDTLDVFTPPTHHSPLMVVDLRGNGQTHSVCPSFYSLFGGHFALVAREDSGLSILVDMAFLVVLQLLGQDLPSESEHFPKSSLVCSSMRSTKFGDGFCASTLKSLGYLGCP